MFRTIKYYALFAFFSPFGYAEPQLIDADSIPKVISAMTLDEKISLLSGTGMNNADKVSGAAGSTYPIPRLGIPQITFADGPVGIRLGGGPTGGEKRFATAFPVSIAMAATWDTDLIRSVGESIGEEAFYYDVDLLLGPAINIQRDPLNGRNFEYFSEDPILNSHIASEYITGLQSKGVGAVVKHFAANNQETRRQTIDEIISSRALNEIYLPGFQYVVKNAKPWSIMSSYPSINGVPSSQNRWLLKDLLRDNWGFKGFVMSDWYGVSDPVKSLLAGNDLNMPGGEVSKDSLFIQNSPDVKKVIEDAIKSGALSQKQLDENIKNILNTIIKTHSFRKELKNKDGISINHSILSRKVASESMVLLKNNQRTLPIKSHVNIAAFGDAYDNFYFVGGGSAEVNMAPERVITLKEGIENSGSNVSILSQDSINKDSLKNIASTTDVAIIVIGRVSTEGTDRYSMSMNSDEIDLIRKVSSSFHNNNKKVIVLLNIGSPIEVSSWEKYVDAILVTWQPGEQAGNAVADILTGKVNPSGKLPLTFPARYTDTPSFGNFPGSKKSVIYGEGIYVGYRYFDTKEIEPMYPFGFGLSYSDFEYGDIKVQTNKYDSQSSEKLEVSVSVKNISDINAQEVVQLYIHDDSSRLDRPLQELKGFSKVQLNPGESKNVSFHLDKHDFSYYDMDKEQWILEPGRFTIRIGNSSRSIKTQTQISVLSNHPAFSFDTPWIDVQMYKDAASIISNVIGDEATNSWDDGEPTLGQKLDKELNGIPSIDDKNKIKEKILKDINEL